jgi:RNA polymerase sigma factor (sigma-70 family)
MQSDDPTLLREYARGNSEEAFAALVTRHVNLVYSVVLRQVGDPHLAEEIAQAVFIILARKADSLGPKTILPGWLCRTARYVAANALTIQRRRQHREQKAFMESRLNEPEPESNAWQHIAPLLDAAMEDLDQKQHDAVVLRFFEGRNFKDVGAAMGVSEAAAKMRVNRALEKLGKFFSKCGVVSTTAIIASAISANSVQAAPAALAGAVSATAFSGTTATAAAIAAATKAIVMTTLQKTVIIGAAVVTIAAAIYLGQENIRLNARNRALESQWTATLAQTLQAQSELNNASNRVALMTAQLAKMERGNAELLKLRGEVTQLKSAADEPSTDAAAKDWLNKIVKLKQRLEEMPDKKIPELQFLTEKDWGDASWNADLDTDDGIRQALSKLRELAENTFLNEMMKAAMKKYLAANNDILPADLLQLEPFFDVPVTDAMLQRYKLLQTGKVDDSAPLVELSGRADPDYDTSHGMSINGAWGGGFNHVQEAVRTAASSYAGDNNGQWPSDPSQISAYLSKPVDAGTVQKYLNQMANDRPPVDVITLGPALKAYADQNSGKAPEDPAGLMPYVTTPDQKAALQRIIAKNPSKSASQPVK